MAKSKSVLPSAAASKVITHHWFNDEFSARYPGLYEFLAVAIADGAPRKGGSLHIFCSDGKLQASFLDKETQMTFYVDLKPGPQLLDELEAILSGDHDAWKSCRKEITKAPF